MWKREKQRYETTCCLEGCLSPTRTTNNNQKTKAVGFLNNFVFTSPKKETTLKGVEEFRKHFRATRISMDILAKYSATLFWEALKDLM